MTAIERFPAEIKIMAGFATPEQRCVGVLQVIHAYVCNVLCEEPLIPSWTPETDRLSNVMAEELAAVTR